MTRALLADLGEEPGALPLLSTALLELWQARDKGWLTLASYHASGGVHGAVARLAENAYSRLTEEQGHIARSIFLRLSGLGEGTSVVRRRVPLSELDPTNDEPTAAVLHLLTDARLLTTGDGYVEVAHEALLREWPRLQAMARGRCGGTPATPSLDQVPPAIGKCAVANRASCTAARVWPRLLIGARNTKPS